MGNISIGLGACINENIQFHNTWPSIAEREVQLRNRYRHDGLQFRGQLTTSFGGLEVKAHPILYLVAIVLASKSLQKFNGSHRSLKILVILLS